MKKRVGKSKIHPAMKPSHGMTCPCCPVTLQDVISHHVETHQCPRCAGFWLSAAELDKFSHFDPEFPLRADKPVQGKITGAHCPYCKKFLKRSPYVPGSSFQVDRCPSCKGVWLEADQIEKVRRAFTKR